MFMHVDAADTLRSGASVDLLLFFLLRSPLWRNPRKPCAVGKLRNPTLSPFAYHRAAGTWPSLAPQEPCTKLLEGEALAFCVSKWRVRDVTCAKNTKGLFHVVPICSNIFQCPLGLPFWQAWSRRSCCSSSFSLASRFSAASLTSLLGNFPLQTSMTNGSMKVSNVAIKSTWHKTWMGHRLRMSAQTIWPLFCAFWREHPHTACQTPAHWHKKSRTYFYPWRSTFRTALDKHSFPKNFSLKRVKNVQSHSKIFRC